MPEDGKKSGDSFARLLGDAKPLGGRRQQIPGKTKPQNPAAPDLRFLFPKEDFPLLARAPDCDPKRFDQLRRGRIDPDDVIDLHGLRKAEAQRAMLRQMREAWDAGHDCVRVIHGKGLSSEATPVLRQALPGWLTSPPLAAHVLAFAPARADLGGSGATLVLLRPE